MVNPRFRVAVATLCMGAILTILAHADEQANSDQTSADTTYRVLPRADVEKLGGRKPSEEGEKHSLASLANDNESLQKGLNKLAKDGWEVAAIEGGRGTSYLRYQLSYDPVYIFKRSDP